MYIVYTTYTQVRNLCYDLLPVQYTELTHQLIKFLFYAFLSIYPVLSYIIIKDTFVEDYGSESRRDGEGRVGSDDGTSEGRRENL